MKTTVETTIAVLAATRVAAALLPLLAVAAQAAPYTFINVADSAGEFAGFDRPSINAAGTVAFVARLDVGGRNVYTASGGRVTPIALSSDEPFSGFGSGGTPINDSGRVAFVAGLDVGGDGIFTSDGVTTATIAHGKPPFAAFGIVRPVSINAAGTVAFQATLSSGGLGIFIGNGGGEPTSLYTHSDSDFLGFGINVQLNNAGTVAFGASLDAGGSGVFTGDGGVVTPIALSSGDFGLLDDSVFSMNAAGAVAFRGDLDSGPSGLYIGNASGTDMIYLGEASAASIDSGERVAFLASSTTDEEAILVGDTAGTQRILRHGDLLFDSTVTVLRLSNCSLNGAGQIAFAYTLADGRNGIAIATPPDIRIVSIEHMAGGNARLQVSGVPNLLHIIQATPNLNQSFAPIGSKTATSNGTFVFEDTDAPAFQHRFYRVALP